ncbi:helix-turn-helix domain-containing protein [Rhizobium binxianense]
MNIGEVFAANLRKMRHAKGLSQEELAHRAGLHRTYVSSLERCQYSPTIETVANLADILEVEAADLLKTNKPKQPARKQTNPTVEK